MKNKMTEGSIKSIIIGQHSLDNLLRLMGGYLATALGVNALYIVFTSPVLFLKSPVKFYLSGFIITLIPVFILALLLFLWRNGSEQKKLPWFFRINSFIFVLLIVIVSIIPIIWVFLNKSRFPVPGGIVPSNFGRIIELRNYIMITISLWWCMGRRFSLLPLLAGVTGWIAFHIIELWQGGIVITIFTRPEHFLYTTKSEVMKKAILEIFYFYRLFDITNPYVLRSTFKTYLQPIIIPIILYCVIIVAYNLIGRLQNKYINIII